MADAFRTARLIRKKRTKWWRDHIPLAYAVLIASLVTFYIAAAFVDHSMPRWLRNIGVTPSGLYLLVGTGYCALGIWGLREARARRTWWIVLYVLCLLGGGLNLLRAFGLI
jgi:cell division protein FtsW (lipid II flippase)